MKKILITLASIAFLSCNVSKQIHTETNKTSLDSANYTLVKETLDSTIIDPADTLTFNNILNNVITDTIGFYFEDDKSVVSIKPNKDNKTFNVVVINKEKKHIIKIDKSSLSETRVVKKAESSSKVKSFIQKMSFGGTVLAIGITLIVILAIIILIRFIYKKYKAILF